MLMLLFNLGGNRYAIEGKRVVEIVPNVGLESSPQAPGYIAGLLEYRGSIVPVIDLCRLILGTSCRSYLSTRIIIVQFQEQTGTPSMLGLMAEKVTDTLHTTDSSFVTLGAGVDTAPYSGEVFRDSQGLIRRLRLDDLLPELQVERPSLAAGRASYNLNALLD